MKHFVLYYFKKYCNYPELNGLGPYRYLNNVNHESL